MGIGFVAAFWAFVACFLFLIYVALTLLARRFAIAQVIKKAFLAVVLGSAMIVGFGIVVTFGSGFFPSHVFEANLGFAPTPDVVELHGRQLMIGDSGDAFLRFRASKQTVARIVSERFFEVSKPGQGVEWFPIDGSAPAYWQRMEGPSVRFFKSTENFDRRFAFSRAFISYDEATGVVQFYWQGVD